MMYSIFGLFLGSIIGFLFAFLFPPHIFTQLAQVGGAIVGGVAGFILGFIIGVVLKFQTPVVLSLEWLDRATFIAFCSAVFFLSSSTALVKIACSFAILFFLLKKVAAGPMVWRKSLPSSGVLVSSLLFFSWCFLSIFLSQYPLLSLKAFLGKTLQAAFMFFIACETISSRRRAGIALVVLLSSAGLVCLDGLWQYFFGYDLLVHAPFADGRVMATFKHPNDLGAYLVFVILPVFVLAAVAFLSFARERSFKNLGVGLLGGAFAVLVSTVLGLTYSRGAWLGAIAAVFVFLLLARRFWWFLLGCVVFFGYIFSPMLFQHRNVLFISDSVADPFTLGGSGRLSFWKDASRIIQDHPVFGTGLNTYSEVIKGHAVSWKAYPHNCYLQMGAEIGLVGLLFFVCFLIAMMVNVSRRIRKMPKGFDRWIFAAFFAGWCGVLLHSGLDTTLYSSQLSAFFWMMSGVLMASFRRDLGGAHG